MGSFQTKKAQQGTPAHLSYSTAQELLTSTAEYLTNARNQLRFELRLKAGSLIYNQRDWRKSSVSGTLQALPRRTLDETGEAVVLDLDQVHRIHQLLHQLRVAKTPQTPTPTPNEQDRECCICYQAKAQTVLPCTHSYCAACTSKYIIEKEEHRCPQCRTEFSGSRESVQRSFYEVIEEDKVVFEEVRTIILDYLAKYNLRALRMLALR